MELSTIIMIVTFLVTIFLGLITKKVEWVNNKLIPIQNLLIGVVSAIIYYGITKDFNIVIAGIGLFAGGTYDIQNNLKKLFDEDG